MYTNILLFIILLDLLAILFSLFHIVDILNEILIKVKYKYQEETGRLEQKYKIIPSSLFNDSLTSPSALTLLKDKEENDKDKGNSVQKRKRSVTRSKARIKKGGLL